MMIPLLIWVIDIIVQLLSLLIIVKVVLSYFMSPYHPVRVNIDRVIEPLLAPIRRVLPPLGMMDFSPLVLLLLVQLSGTIIIRVLNSLSF